MESVSRRKLIGTIAATAGTAGLVSASSLEPSLAAAPRKVRVTPNRKRFKPGQRMVLRVHEELGRARKIRVTDTSGLSWKRVKRTRHRQVWEATAHRSGAATVRVNVLWPDGGAVKNRRYRDRVSYDVGWETSLAAGAPLIGMSAPPADWGKRVAEVGAGLTARRIFADLAAGPASQVKTIAETHAAGMLPVVSYKVGGDIEGAVNGQFNAAAQAAAAQLASFGLPTAVTFWHEPHSDMTTAQYVAASRQILPHFKQGELRVGPLLNGFLLDRQTALFSEYCPDDLMELWDWFGIDTYQLGSLQQPGEADPATRIHAMSDYVRGRGYDLPLGVGEYNGFTAQAIASTGEALLSTPNVWFGCIWNSNGERDYTLSGDRLVAFQQTLQDPRSAKPGV